MFLRGKIPIDLDKLQPLYEERKYSAAEIAQRTGFSVGKVNYWLAKYGIKKRSISDAIYTKHNPNGDPFAVRQPTTIQSAILYGIGIGLYWGEGHKRNKVSIRLGNTSSALIVKFVEFLVKICGVKKESIGFHLMVFDDTDAEKIKRYWIEKLGIKPQQIRGKVTKLKSRGEGTYRQKAEHGVLILQYHNKRLRDILCAMVQAYGEAPM